MEFDSLVINGNLVSIKPWAFAYIKINNLTIPKSMINYGVSEIFGGTSDVTSWANNNCKDYMINNLYFDGDVSDWLKLSFESEDYYDFETFAFHRWANNINFKNEQGYYIPYSIVIPEGTKKINNYAFYNFRSIFTVSLPSTLNKIGDYSFEACSSIYEIANRSSLNITLGSDYDNGEIVYYAKVINTESKITNEAYYK